MSDWFTDKMTPGFVLTLIVVVGGAVFAWANVSSHCESEIQHPTMTALDTRYETRDVADERFEHIKDDLSEIKADVRSIRRTVSR